MAHTADNGIVEDLPQREVDLNGEFRLKVDGKGRITLPAKFRKVLSADLTVTPSHIKDEPCVYAFETPDFNQWVENVMNSAFPERKANDIKQNRFHRGLKASANSVEVDSAGRIMLSADMRKKAGIEKDIVVVGNGSRFEVWDAERYDAMMDEVDLGELFS